MTETSTGRTLPVYNAIDSSSTPAQKAAIQASLDRAPDQLNFLSDLFGPYPFDSTGAVADRAAGVGYALEVQTKPHYSGGFTSGNPSINIGTQAARARAPVGRQQRHPADLERHLDQRGLGELVGVVLAVQRERRRRPGRRVRRPVRQHPGRGLGDRARCPRRRPHATCSRPSPTYDRGAMTVQGYREIVGDDVFFEFAQDLARRFEHDNISTREFIAFAVARSGLDRADRAQLRELLRAVAVRRDEADDPPGVASTEPRRPSTAGRENRSRGSPRPAVADLSDE